MKYLLTLAALLSAAILMGADAATLIGHDKVADALAKGGTLAATKEYIVLGSHRDVAGQVEMHEKETDIIYITDGEATFVTGGSMVGGKMSKAGQWLGTDITGGQTHHLTKGDVVTVPARMPHWFKEVPKSVSYFVVKVLED